MFGYSKMTTGTFATSHVTASAKVAFMRCIGRGSARPDSRYRSWIDLRIDSTGEKYSDTSLRAAEVWTQS